MNRGLSYSNWATLRQCGQKYKLQVLDKVPTAPAVALEFGSALHAGLHDALVTKDPESAMDVFEAYWRSAVDKLNFTGERHGKEDLQSMGTKFVSNFTKRYASKMKFLVGEKRMYANLLFGLKVKEVHPSSKMVMFCDNEVALEGSPDALVEYEDKNVLLDFKSAAYAYVDEKLDSSLQLNLYAWLLEQNGYKVDAIAYAVFVKGTGSIQTLRTIPYNGKKALQLIQEMVTFFKRNETHHEKNPNGCVMGKSICPYFERCWK